MDGVEIVVKDRDEVESDDLDVMRGFPANSCSITQGHLSVDLVG